MGSKKNPIWRIVVADQRSPRDGRFIEMLGHYNPQTQPSEIQMDRERLDHWLARGARPSNTVRKLMRIENTAPPVAAAPPEPEPTPKPEPEAAPEPEPEAPAEAPAEAEASEDAPAG